MIRDKRDMTRVMPLFVFLIIYISKYVERLHFGKSRDMEAIVLHYHVEKAVALCARKSK